MGPRAVLEMCGESRPTGTRSPDRPTHSTVVLPTEISRPDPFDDITYTSVAKNFSYITLTVEHNYFSTIFHLVVH